MELDDKWLLGKAEHKRLSDAAAEDYDALYAASNFATGSYMNYELQIIDRAVELLDRHRRRIALDLGCGTGRDAFHYHKDFVQVRGYDFAENMIHVAHRKKLSKAAGNIQFQLRDIERDLLTDAQNASVALITSGFGMGSFLSELSPLLREVKRVLEPGGVFVCSFYNRESLVLQLETVEWLPSLAAKLDTTTGFLKVKFKGDSFEVSVRPYSSKEVNEILGSYFEVIELSTFPTLSALFPNSIFSSPKARELCTIVDRELRLNREISGGPYIAAICRKRGTLDVEAQPLGYANIMRLLADNRIVLNVREHAPVKSPDEVATALQVPKSELIKSILIKILPRTGTEAPTPRPINYYAIVLQADRVMDFARVAQILQVRRSQIEIATAHEVEEMTGFTIGGIPPFGYPRSINVILDERIRSLDNVYCGTGKRTESLRLSVSDLIRLASPVPAAISKERAERKPHGNSDLSDDE